MRPNALSSWPSLQRDLKGRELAIFLDYDGTLSPIVDVPSEAKISADMRAAVERISMLYPTAIITGRNIKAITNFVKLDTVYYAGSHGFDIRFPGGRDIMAQVGGELLPLLKDAAKAFAEKFKSVKGALVEDNTYSVSVHYRLVDPSLHGRMRDEVKDYLAKSGGKLRMGNGKMVFELKPNIDWHKGKAVMSLLARLQKGGGPVGVSNRVKSNKKGEEDEDQASVCTERGGGDAIGASVGSKRPRAAAPNDTEFKTTKRGRSVGGSAPDSSTCGSGSLADGPSAAADRRGLYPIYVGDDTTDEDAFRELRRAGAGLGIRVLSKDSGSVRQTQASYTLRSVKEVKLLIEKLCKLKSSADSDS